MSDQSTGLQKLFGVRKNETAATFAATVLIFLLLASYYILRPVRDAMASDWSDSEVAFLWNLNLIASAVMVSLLGLAVSKLPLKRIIPTAYILFAGSFLLFYAMAMGGSDREIVDKAFYLWVSIFALFNTALFWILMADTFSKSQSKRLFAIIASGASAGAIVGPLIPVLFAERLGIETLMLIASTGLLLAMPLVAWLYRLKVVALGNDDVEANADHLVMGGRWWHGFKTFFTNPYLLLIGAFILLYVFISSFIYFEQKNLLAVYDREARTQLLGGVDLAANIMTFVLAFFVTGRIVTRLGMPVALALMPVFVALCLLVLAFAPLLIVVLALQIARRGGNYGLTRPAREMLYTKVSRENRFKTKPVIDIVVYRGGDAFSGSLFAVFTEGLGLGLAAVAAIGAAIAALWGWVAVRLGRVFDSQSHGNTDPR